MVFNSYEFPLFLLVVFFFYWFVFRSSLKYQNLFLVLASYTFYGWWDWRFLCLLFLSTGLDYYTGLRIGEASSQKTRKLWLYTSVITNLSILGVFKYFNFFISSFTDLFHAFGLQAEVPLLNVILPIGISFYTFHGLSYVIDIYNKKAPVTRSFVDYSLFVCFFPLLVAGPIERATHLLPQIQKPRVFSPAIATDGLRQILWGLFKKIVVADTCASMVDTIFAGHQSYSGSALLLGGVLFAFQIYGDFSGYSDMALGIAKLLGFDLLKNFSYPYFSRDIAEFWRRWHISLTTWFRDYVYIPLGGNRVGKSKAIVNVFIIFLLSGIWHGANWTFVVWGLYNAVLFIPLMLSNANRVNMNTVAEDRYLPSLREVLQMGLTFFLVVMGWIIFRAENISQAFSYFSHMFSRSLFTVPTEFRSPLPWILLLVVVEWLQRNKEHGLSIDPIRPRLVRWSIYLVLVVIVVGGFTEQRDFIYFQF